MGKDKSNIRQGEKLHKNSNFNEKNKEKSNKLIENIEKNRINWNKGKGNLIVIDFEKQLNQDLLFNIIKNNRSIFEILIFPLYKKENFSFFDCMALQTADRFKLQIFKDKIYVNLNADSSGDIILKFFLNLQAYLSQDLHLKIDNQKKALI